MDPHTYQALLRQDFYTFIHRSFAALCPQTDFLHSPHIELIAAKLDACRQGTVRRLIINIPPRSLKSHCASIAFPAFLLGHDPACSIICASYGQDLADKLAYDCRRLMGEPFYQDIFPTRIARDRRSVSDFSTTSNGCRLATSVEGPMTGRGADFIIIDDPLKPDEAMSDTIRQKANDWIDHTVMSRLNDKQTGCVIVIMQRLHLDDLTGHLLEQEGWELLSLPAIAEKEEAMVYDTPFGLKTFTRHAGELLHPAREPMHVLEELRHRLGEYHFSGQYQQAPVPLGGGIVKTSWLRYYEPYEKPATFEHIVQSWDTANKATELSNYSVCTTWGIKKKEIYLLDCLRTRLDYPDLKRTVLNQRNKFSATTILIEDKASGIQLIQDLKREGVHQVKAVKPDGDKVFRMSGQSNLIENGTVKFPSKADWLDIYLQELTTFPKSKYNDQVDSTSQALEWFKNHDCTASMGVFYFMKGLAEQQGLA